MKPIKASSLCLSLLIVCLFLLATATVFTQTETKKNEPSAKAQAGIQTPGKETVIGYLHTRDKIVAISRGTQGAVYTVKTKEGKILAQNLSEKNFEEKYPVLFNQVKYGLAGNDAMLRKTDTPALLRK